MPLPALTKNQVTKHLSALHENWQLNDTGTALSRKFTTKGYSQALSLTNVCSALADEQNHHPDICFGWGYCSISFTTHSVSALTALDFNCARKLDELASVLFSKS